MNNLINHNYSGAKTVQTLISVNILTGKYAVRINSSIREGNVSYTIKIAGVIIAIFTVSSQNSPYLFEANGLTSNGGAITIEISEIDNTVLDLNTQWEIYANAGIGE